MNRSNKGGTISFAFNQIGYDFFSGFQFMLCQHKRVSTSSSNWFSRVRLGKIDFTSGYISIDKHPPNSWDLYLVFVFCFAEDALKTSREYLFHMHTIGVFVFSL